MWVKIRIDCFCTHMSVLERYWLDSGIKNWRYEWLQSAWASTARRRWTNFLRQRMFGGGRGWRGSPRWWTMSLRSDLRWSFQRFETVQLRNWAKRSTEGIDSSPRTDSLSRLSRGDSSPRIDSLWRTDFSTDHFLFHVSVEINVNAVKLSTKKPYHVTSFHRMLFFHVSKEWR